MSRSAAKILREYGPYDGAPRVNGVTFDGAHVWFASGDKIHAFDPKDGTVAREIAAPQASAGTAFDGRYLYQLAESRIDKIDPKTGKVVASIPAPNGGGSGLTWAEGKLWIGQYQDRKILEIDPETGAVLRTVASNRHVTGVSWVDGELWHATWEADESTLRRVDPRDGTVLEELAMPEGVGISGLESDGKDAFFCGGGTSGKVRVVARPKRSGAKRG
jgi:streptogramin lyase